MADQAPSKQPLASFSGNRRVPPPVNEPVRSYAPGSPERAELKARLKADGRGAHRHPARSSAGRRSARARPSTAVMPHDHAHVLADWHKAAPKQVERGDRGGGRGAAGVVELAAGRIARRCFLKAAELLADDLARRR